MSPDRKYAIVRLGKENYGISIGRMVEILKRQDVVALPDLSSSVLGVIHLRGKVVPVVDLRIRFRVSPGVDAKDRIVIVRTGRERVGFVVDDVIEIASFPREAVNPPPGVVTAGIKSEYLEGITYYAGGMVVLLDLDRILAADEVDQIREAIDDDAA